MSEPTNTPAVVPATTTETKPAATPSVETSNQPKVDQLEAHFSTKPAPKEPAKVAARSAETALAFTTLPGYSP